MMTSETQFVISGSREVREIPKGWRHPTDDRRRHIPLLPFGYRFDEDQTAVPTMPPALGDTEIAVYETTTEGTPITPAFPNTAAGRLAMVEYCVQHCTTFGEHRSGIEGWAALLFGDAAVALDGRVLR